MSKKFRHTQMISLLLSAVCISFPVHVFASRHIFHDTGSDTSVYRDPYTWPFPQSSIWNMPVGSEAVYVFAGLKKAEKGAWIDEDIIITTPDQPEMDVFRTNYRWGKGVNPETRCIKADDEVLYQLPVPPGYVTNFHATRANHGAAILMKDGRSLMFTQPFQVCSGGYATTYYTKNRMVDIFSGDGIAGSHGGSGMSGIGGTIRMGELLPDTPPIQHALKLDLWGKYNLYWDEETDGYRWPAFKSDGCTPDCYQGQVKACRMGSLLALKPDIDIEHWGLETIPGKKIAHAFQDYGGYVVDDAAQDVFTLCTEEGSGRNVAREFEAEYGYPMKNNDFDNPWVRDIIRIFTNLYVIDNNGPGRIGGGGEPRKPLAPPLLPAYRLTLETDRTVGAELNFPATTTVVKGRETRISVTSVPEGFHFKSWEVISGEARVDDPARASTTVILPSGDATLRANFVKMEAFAMDWEGLAEGDLDLSFILDKPAGKKGFIEIKNGHFYTPGGKPFRIWGVNLTGGACYPEKEQAPLVARFLAHLGINAIRFHFLDSDWGSDMSIFPSDTNTTRVLDPGQLDRLDYFVSELKKQGIYANFNLNVGRNYREGDDVPFYQYLGLAKAVTLFDDRIIELEKEYAKMLLTHKNAYTGNEYRNEPALAFLEIVNENSLVEAWMRGHLQGTHNTTRTGTWIDIPEYYAVELTRKYNHWLKDKLDGQQMDSLYLLTGVTKGDLIPRLSKDEIEQAPEWQFKCEARFIIDTENAFYSGMYRFLKDSLKVHQCVAANSDHSHYRSSYALLSNTSKLDYVDGHVYWQHPSYATDPRTGERTFTIENTPMVNDPFWSTVVQLSRSPVVDMPYTVSETNHPYPNEFSCEGFVSLAAYGLLQDWDGFYFYTFEHQDPLNWKEKIPNYFEIQHDPVKMANLAAACLMFHRGDVQSAQKTVLRNYNETDILNGIRHDTGNKPYFTPGFSPAIPLIYKTRIRSFSGGSNHFPDVSENGPFRAETGELTWYRDNNRGLVVVDTKKTQALIGFSAAMRSAGTENLKVNSDTPFLSAVLTSVDGKDIGRSARMLLSLTATAILSDAQWNRSRTTLLEWGHKPFMIEPVTGKITFTGLQKAKELKVFPLDGAGNKSGNPVVIKPYRGGECTFDPASSPGVWYLLEVKN